MRLWAVSDLHTDFAENQRWVANLSRVDYQQDCVIIAGDISDKFDILEQTLLAFCERFHKVCFVPGNHDLWVDRGRNENSLKKWHRIQNLLQDLTISTRPCVVGKVELVPLLSWYDYSFGLPTEKLKRAWMDYQCCHWPAEINSTARVCEYFLAQNADLSSPELMRVSYSHFLPRIDIMPRFIPPKHRLVYPVLGSWKLDEQLRERQSQMHIYGHSHVNRDLVVKGVRYLNSALGYPSESWLKRSMHCVLDDVEAV